MTDITIRSSNLDNLAIGELGAKWSARGDRILRYYIDLRHTKMNLHKEVSAPELFILQSKVDALLAAWDEKFKHFQVRQLFQSGKEAAEEMTSDAIRQQEALGRILSHTLKVNDAVEWDSLKDRSEYAMPISFPEGRPQSSPEPKPNYVEPKIGFLDVLFGKKARLLQEAQDQHDAAVRAWNAAEANRQTRHSAAVSKWEAQEATFWADHHGKKAEFLADQAASHAKVDLLRGLIREGDPDAVIEQVSLVLENSDYDGLFEKSYTVQYHRDQKLLLLAYDLPAPDALPQTRSVKFVKTTGELAESRISEREKKANFESVVYQICLRTIHEIFEADEDGNIESVLFNGMVNFINPATGQEQRCCIMSSLVKKDDFCEIDLSRVDPKSCFKSLKGVSAASLGALTPIPPVMEMDREDKRFIEAREISSAIDETTNLASISWEDFEHLVRELFEREFLSRGGEVKVTQSSSDGGVDAVAFDPDPISGGKIVIQAKRYTRTVGVSAVRDLYGTVMNEGASKGILVTTADYGPDAYRFANGKPLTLLNGSNLLHLLQRHGYSAQIDIKAARLAAT